MPIWKFNRGDWSEAYVFLKLLGGGRIFGATPEFERDPSNFMEVIEVLRFENNRPKDNVLKFKRSVSGSLADISARSDDVEFAIITSTELSNYAEKLYNAIRTVTDGRRKIEIPEIQNYLEAIKFSSPKAPAFTVEQSERYGSKTDIVITTKDSIDHVYSTNGFSIKSHIGSPSTLLNFADGSNMVYKVEGCTEEKMHLLNAIESQNEMIQTIKNDPTLSLQFIDSKRLTKSGVDIGSVFGENLAYIDTRMITVIGTAVLVLCGYTDISAESSNIEDITKAVAIINPLNIRNNPQSFYEAKFKDLLFASFAGMTASTPWDGRRRITGGYIDVNRDGEMLFYRALSDDIFNSYLFKHTFMDKPQRGKNYDIAHQKAKWFISGQQPNETIIKEISRNIPKKGDCAYIYQSHHNGEPCYCLNLNFQIRFR